MSVALEAAGPGVWGSLPYRNFTCPQQEDAQGTRPLQSITESARSRSADRRSWLVPPPRRQVNPSGLCAPLLAMLSMASSNRVPGRGQRPPQPHLCSSRPSCRPSGSTWGTVAACPPFSWLAGGSGHLPRGLPRCGPAPEGRASFQKLHHNRLWHLW